jgi:hypothetical protein
MPFWPEKPPADDLPGRTADFLQIALHDQTFWFCAIRVRAIWIKSQSRRLVALTTAWQPAKCRPEGFPPSLTSGNRRARHRDRPTNSFGGGQRDRSLETDRGMNRRRSAPLVRSGRRIGAGDSPIRVAASPSPRSHWRRRRRSLVGLGGSVRSAAPHPGSAEPRA